MVDNFTKLVVNFNNENNAFSFITIPHCVLIDQHHNYSQIRLQHKTGASMIKQRLAIYCMRWVKSLLCYEQKIELHCSKPEYKNTIGLVDFVFFMNF